MRARLRITTTQAPEIFVFTECEYEYSSSDVATISFSQEGYLVKADYTIGLHRDKITLGMSMGTMDEERPLEVYFLILEDEKHRVKVDFGAWRATFFSYDAVCDYGPESAEVMLKCKMITANAGESMNLLKINLKII